MYKYPRLLESTDEREKGDSGKVTYTNRVIFSNKERHGYNRKMTLHVVMRDLIDETTSIYVSRSWN